MGSTGSLAYRRRWIGVMLALVTMIIVHGARSQNRALSITATAGYGFLNLNGVDTKNASDAEGWSRLGYPVGAFPTMKRAPYFSGRITYRSTREFALSVYGSYSTKSVSLSYVSEGATLQLDRSVGAADLCLGIAYYPSLQPYFLEWYLQANAGIIIARASATAYGLEASKPSGVVVMTPFVDSEGTYSKTKTSVLLFVGADMPVVSGLFLKGELGYRVAQLGEMDGNYRRFEERSSGPSVTTFDFSGVLINVGVSFQL